MPFHLNSLYKFRMLEDPVIGLQETHVLASLSSSDIVERMNRILMGSHEALLSSDSLWRLCCRA